MANMGMKAACMGAIGVATLWQGQKAKADEIYTGATVTVPVDVTHAHVLYTSNVSVVQTENTSAGPAAPVRYANYEVGSVPITGLTASTAGTFDLDFADPSVMLAAGEASAGVVHSLVLVGLDANEQLVVSNSLRSNPNWSMLFGANSYDSVVNALKSDSDAQIGALVAAPSGTSSLPTGYQFGSGLFGSSFNPFGLYTMSDETTATQISVEDPSGGFSTPVQGSFVLPTAVPEPASAALFGVPIVTWALGRRRRRA